MKISRRMMEKKMKAMYWQGFKEGQEHGRCEVMDIACSSIGRISAQAVNNLGVLHAQALIEGMRLLSYHYEEMPVDEVCSFRERFIDNRRVSAMSKELIQFASRFDVHEGDPKDFAETLDSDAAAVPLTLLHQGLSATGGDQPCQKI